MVVGGRKQGRWGTAGNRPQMLKSAGAAGCAGASPHGGRVIPRLRSGRDRGRLRMSALIWALLRSGIDGGADRPGTVGISVGRGCKERYRVG